MSQSFKIGGAIGGPLDNLVLNQLEQRRNIVSKRSTRSSEDIIYLNSNTGWVRITSAVDVDDESGNTGSELSQLYTLFNGTAQATAGFRPDSPQSSYTNSDTYGFVPAAGITQFDVKSKGTFGTLRDINFGFTVHSPEQFSILEKLYLRPGYTLLVEWGHSIILDDDGNINTNVRYFDKDSFASPMRMDDIQNKINQLKKDNFHNYDAVHGFIKNFSWSYNGMSYECLVDVVSKGELVNSLKAAFAPSNESNDGSDSAEYSAKTFSSDLVKILNKIKKTPSEKFFLEKGTPEGNKSLEEAIIGELKDSSLNMYADAFTEFKVIGGSLGGGETAWSSYISLRNFLEILNKGSLLTSNGDNVVSFYVGTETPSLFTTFPNHIGLDPYICVLPKSKDGDELVYPFSKQASDVKDKGSILNIFLNVDYLLEKVEEIKSASDQLDNTLSNLVNSILAGVQNNLGDINDLGLNYDEEESTYYIVDRNLIPSNNDFERGADNKPKSYIDLVGLNSEIENLSISSTLSEKLTSMIAIASSASPNPTAASKTLNLSKWNIGLVDRHLKNKGVGFSKTPTSPNQKPVSDQNINRIRKHIAEVSIDGNLYYMGYDKEAIKGLSETHNELMGQYLFEITEKKNLNAPGLIPFELSFTMKGISGIKIGQAFKVNEFFLPDRYKGRVGFLVTGVDHSVSEGRWTTSIKSQITVI